MTPTLLLADLSRREIIISATGGSLAIDAPSGSLTDFDKELLRTHKAELLDILTAPDGQHLGALVPRWDADPAHIAVAITAGTCPECNTAMTLQSREPLALFCAGCRGWAVSGQWKPNRRARR